MAYTDDAVRAKLSALNETQESIVTVAQWVMFHRRHAERTGQLWLQRLKDSGAGKRLNLIYLANEVAQQSKARKKDDFLIAFSPIIAEAMATAYKGATNEVQQKLRRVIEVWRQRVIFEPDIQETIENRVNEIDKSRSSGKKSLLGGFSASSSGSSAPSELQPIVSSQIAVSKLALALASTSSTANLEYDKLTDANAPVLSPPVQAARLSSLFKSLANAEGAVSESIKAREALIGGLEQLLETNRTVIARERAQQGELASRKTTIEARKRDVESAILRGLDSDPRSQPHSNGDSFGSRINDQDETKTSSTIEAEPPQMEELTPPPIGSFTPPGPFYANGNSGINAAEVESAHEQGPAHVASPFIPPYAQVPLPAGADLLSSFSVPTTRPYPASPTNVGSTKKRRIESENESEGEDAMAGLDEDVAELLRAESGAR